MFFRCSWHIQKPCPWATTLPSLKLQGGLTGKAESVPGPIVAQPMKQEVHLLPGSVSGSAGNEFMLGPRGLTGPQAALIALGCWWSWGPSAVLWGG